MNHKNKILNIILDISPKYVHKESGLYYVNRSGVFYIQ